MATAQINGVRLHYELQGSGEVPLVLVHGSWDSHHDWDLVVPALSQSFRVLAYDRRGHSQSERPDGQGSVLEDVADLAALRPYLAAHELSDIPDPIGQSTEFFAMVGSKIADLLSPILELCRPK